MSDRAINKVKAAIRMAEAIGADEIVEELGELLEMFIRRGCRKSMKENDMTMYCTEGSCPDHAACSQGDNWFGGTGGQPSKPGWSIPLRSKVL